MEYSPASKSKDIELNKSIVAPNDDVLPQNDDVMISVPSSSTLTVDQSSGTVEIEVDTSKSEQFYDEDIEVKRSGEVKEDVLSQIDDLVIAFSTSFTLADDPYSGPGNDTSFEQLGTVEAGVDKLTSGHDESAMEDIGLKSSGSANDSVLSQSDYPQVHTSFEQSGTVETSVDMLISGQTEESATEDIEVNSSGSAIDNVLSQSDDLKADTSFEQLGTIETCVDKSTSGQIEESAMEDIGLKSSGSANDSILSQSDYPQVHTSFEQSATVETGVDMLISGQTEESATEDIEVNSSGSAIDNVLSQSDDLKADTSFEQLGTIETCVDKSTSGLIEESAMEDIGLKSCGSANDSILSQSDYPQVHTSFEQSATVETSVDMLISGQTEESATEDIEMNSSGSAIDNVLSQSDDLKADTSFEQLGTIETCVDKSTSGQIEESAVGDIEVKSSSSANDNFLSQSDDLQVDPSFEQSGTVETGVDNSPSGHIEANGVENIEVKRCGVANDSVLSQNDDVQIDTRFEMLGTVVLDVDKSTTGQLEEGAVEDIVVKRSGSASDSVLSESDNLQIGTNFELLQAVSIDLDKLTSGQIEENAVEDIEVKRSGSDTDSVLCQSDDLQIDSSFKQPGPAETGADNSPRGHNEVNGVENIEVKRCGVANDSVLSQNDDVQIDTRFEMLGTVVIDVDKSTSGQLEEGAVEDIVVKRSGSASDSVLSESDNLQIGTNSELLRTVSIDLDKSTSGQIEENAVEDIEVKRSGSDTDGVLCQSDDLQIDSSFEQSGPAETDVDKSTSEHKQSTVNDIEVKSSGTANDGVLSQSDDLQIDASPELSGTVEIDVDKSTSEHIEESALKNIEVKRSGTANDGVLSQSDELQIDASPEQLVTVEIDVDKSTSGQIEESAVKDIGVKISGASIDGLFQSNDLPIDPSFERLGTVEVDVDKSTSAQIEENAAIDVEVKRSGAMDGVMLPQSDDLLIAVSTSFVLANVHHSGPGNGTRFEQLGTVDTDIDKLTSDQLEQSDMKDIELNRPGAINNNVLSQNDDLLIAVSSSCPFTDDQSSGPGNETIFEQSGTVEIDVHKSTTEQIQVSDVKDIEVNRSGAANDSVVSQSEDLMAAGLSSTITDDQSSGPGNEAVFEQSGTVELDVDKSATEQIEKSDVKDIEDNGSGAANNDVIFQRPGNGAIIEQSGTVEIGVDNAATGQIEESDVKDIELNIPGAASDLLIAVSSSSILTDDCSSGLTNVTSCEQLGTIEIDVDKSISEQIEECALTDGLLSQSDDLLVAASSSSTLSDDQSSGLGSEARFEQVGTVETHVGNTASDCIEEMPKMVKTSEPVKSGKNVKFNLRKSLAWDSAFFTSDGVLDADELSTMIDRGEKGVKHQLPGIEEEVYRSMDSISTLESDNLSLECLEAELFEDIRASIQKSTRASNTISSSIKVSPGNRDSHAKVSSSSKKVDLDSGKRPVARFKDNGSAIPQPKIITRVNPASTLTKRASLSTNAAKKDQDIIKQAHERDSSSKNDTRIQGNWSGWSSKGVPKSLPSSKSSSLGSKTEPTRPSSSCSNSSSCSSGTDVKTSVNLSRKKVESKTGKLIAGSVPQTSSRISTKPKAPAPANSRLPSRFVSSKLSSRISSASSASELSSESTSPTSSIDRRSTSRGSIDTRVSYRSSVESVSSIHSTDQNSSQNGNQAVVVPQSQTGSLSRPPSAQPTGLRMPSPKIGFFDGGKSGVRTPTGGIRSQSGLPTGPTSSNGVKSVKLPQSKIASAHTNMKPNKQSNPGNKLSCKTNTPGNDHLEMSNSSSEVHSKDYLVAGKDNKVDKSVTDSSRTPFAVKNSVYDI